MAQVSATVVIYRGVLAACLAAEHFILAPGLLDQVASGGAELREKSVWRVF